MMLRFCNIRVIPKNVIIRPVRPNHQLHFKKFCTINLPQHKFIELSAVSPVDDSFTLVAWKKKVGDKVNKGSSEIM